MREDHLRVLPSRSIRAAAAPLRNSMRSPCASKKRRHSASFLLARQKGFEPPAFPLGGGRSIRLSYWRVSDGVGGKSSHAPLILPAAAAFVNAKKFLRGTSHPVPKVL